MWEWLRKPKEGFPKGFRVQSVGVRSALFVSDLTPEEIYAHFRRDTESAECLLQESYDKRYSPSTFITEEGSGYSVGWVSRGTGYESVRRFTKLEDAATDYLLFSLGKGRWTEREVDSSN